MLLASNLDISLLTTRSTTAEKGGLPACLEQFWWALFGMMTRGHCLNFLIFHNCVINVFSNIVGNDNSTDVIVQDTEHSQTGRNV